MSALRPWLAGCALALLLSSARLAYALPDELEIRLDEVTPVGRVGLEMFASYVPSRRPVNGEDELRPSFQVLQVSPSLSWGVARNTHVEFQVFTSAGPRDDARVDGARAGLLLLPLRPSRENDGYWAGLLVEVGRLPRTISTNRLDAEIKVLLGLRRGPWAFAINPEIQTKISGNGPGQTELGIRFKALYALSERLHAGIEHYGDLGEFGRIGRLSEREQLTFAVAEVEHRDWQLNIGIGHGWTAVSERWVLKSVIGFPIAR